MKVAVLSEPELASLVESVVKSVVSALKSLDAIRLPETEKLSRAATAAALGVSLATMDRIAARHPDLIPKRRDEARKPYFYQSDVARYLAYLGKSK